MRSLQEDGRLEQLAVELGNSFLSAPGNSGQVISLYGQTPEVLDVLRECMEAYFREKGKEVMVQVGREGYSIDVGFFVS